MIFKLIIKDIKLIYKKLMIIPLIYIFYFSYHLISNENNAFSFTYLESVVFRLVLIFLGFFLLLVMDKQNNFNRLIKAIPTNKNDIVISKFILSIIISLFSLILFIAINSLFLFFINLTGGINYETAKVLFMGHFLFGDILTTIITLPTTFAIFYTSYVITNSIAKAFLIVFFGFIVFSGIFVEFLDYLFGWYSNEFINREIFFGESLVGIIYLIIHLLYFFTLYYFAKKYYAKKEF